jgi:hypothetical protein
MDLKTLVHRYYEAWAARDRAAVRALLSDDLTFKSVEDTFDSADTFLSTCWKYSEGLTGVRCLKELYDGDQAFVILRWQMQDGTTFAGAEYLRVDGGRIREIMVVNSDFSFTALIA